jgi:hypothetical protein
MLIGLVSLLADYGGAHGARDVYLIRETRKGTALRGGT